ncbi:MAG: SPOR domain-containing protein [Candidatus Rokuibacteriota bacterium]
MTPTDDRDDPEEPRSILSAMWFRVLLVIVVLGVIAVLAVPHVLDMVNAPPTRQAASVKLAPGPTPAMPPAPPSPSPTPAEQAVPPSAAPTPSVSQPSPAPPAEVAKEPPPLAPAEPASKALAAKGVDKSTDKPGRGGAYWVQVGAFRDATTAQRLAERLRAENYSVTESVRRKGAPATSPAATSTATGEAGDRYNVFVSGMPPTELTAKLSAKGLNGDAVAGGAVIKPSLSLREAVALSRDLATDGLQVQVRRAGRGEASSAVAPSTAAGADAYHRVRVGGFPDRAAALAVAKELEGKGYRPYIARGNR